MDAMEFHKMVQDKADRAKELFSEHSNRLAAAQALRCLCNQGVFRGAKMCSRCETIKKHSEALEALESKWRIVR